MPEVKQLFISSKHTAWICFWVYLNT